MKLKNNTKNRNATANEISKSIIIDRLECCYYYQDNNAYCDNYSKEFLEEINKHMYKHIKSIEKRLNPNSDYIERFY